MKYIEVDKVSPFGGWDTEVVPESYLNIGAYQLMITENDEFCAMLEKERAKLSFSPGFPGYIDIRMVAK